MRSWRWVALSLGSMSFPTASASAQDVPAPPASPTAASDPVSTAGAPLEPDPPPPPPPPPGEPAATYPAPVAPTWTAAVSPVAPTRDEAFRFRAGISSAVGPSVGDFPGWMVSPVQLRLGVQIVEEVALVYQNTLYFIFFEAPGSSSNANIVDQNALLGIVTLANVVDLGGGVSLDVFGTGDGASLGPGLQARVAVNLGPGPDEETGRRTAFNLGVDLHATFVDDDAAVVIPFGLGAEFF